MKQKCKFKDLKVGELFFTLYDNKQTDFVKISSSNGMINAVNDETFEGIHLHDDYEGFNFGKVKVTFEN